MVDQSLQQPIEPPSIHIEGGTPELRDRYQRAFAALPDNVRTVIAQSQPTFVIGQGIGNYLVDKKIVLPSNITGPAEPMLLSLGLAHALPLKFDKGTLRQAVADVVRENLPPAARHMRAAEVETKVDQLIAGMSKDGDLRLIGMILGAGFMKFPPGSPINKADPFYQTSAGQVYSAYMDALQEQGKGQHAQVDAPASQQDPGPRIVTDSKYGADVTQKDIDTFLAGYAQWDDWIKQAIKANNVTFVIGHGRPDAGRKYYDPAHKEVEIDVEMIHRPEYRQGQQAMYMCEALLGIMHDKMPVLDWNEAQEEFERVQSKQAGRTFSLEKFSLSSIKAMILSGAHGTAINNPGRALSVTMPRTSKLYKTFMDAARKEASQLAAPRIIKDPKYGASVTQQDIDTFLAGYEQWDDWVKAAVKAHNLTFIIGKNQPQKWNNVFAPDAEGLHLDANDINSQESRNDNQSVAMCAALIHVMHNKLSADLPWEKAEQEIIELGKRTGTSLKEGNVSMAAMLGSTHRQILKDKGNREILAEECPLGLELYDKFMDAARKGATKIESTGVHIVPLLSSSPQDRREAAAFQKIYDNWPPEVRTIFEHEGITFQVTRGKHAPTRADRLLKSMVVNLDTIPGPRGTDMVMMTALLAFLSPQPQGINWDAAIDQLQQHWNQTGHSDIGKPDRSHVLETVHLAVKNGDSNVADCQRKSPAVYEAYDRYMQFVREKAAEFSPPTEATDKAFVINTDEKNGLTKPQQAYFGKLNDIIALLGVSPKEFDEQFKFSVAHAAHICAGSQQIKEMDTVNSRSNTDAKPVRQADQEKDRQLSASYDAAREGLLRENDFGNLPYEVTPAVLKREKIDFKLLQRLSQQDLTAATEHNRKIIGFVSGMFECINLPLPEGADDYERKIHQKINWGDRKIVATTSDGKQGTYQFAGDIILQRVASGRWKFDVLNNQRMDYATNVAKYQTPSCGDFLRVSVANAALTIAKKKDIGGERLEQLTQKLEEMNQSWPQIVMTKAEYQRFEGQEAERERRRQEALERTRIVKEKEETARLERQRQAEEEAKQPKPYPSGLNGSDAPVAQEVHAFCQILDCRIPSQQRLGDTLLSPEIFQVITTHIAGQPGQVKALLNSGKHPEVAEALRLAQTTIEDLFKLKPEQIPAEQKEITERIKQSLLQSPIFLSFILGKQKLIDEAQQCRSEAGELGEDGAAYIKEHVHNMLSQHWPTLAAIVIPPVISIPINEMIVPPKAAEPPPIADKSLEPVTLPSPPGDTPIVPPTAAEKEPPAGIIPLIPVAAAAGAAALIETPVPVTPPQPAAEETKQPIKEPAAPDVPDAGKIEAPPQPIVTETVAMPLATVLKDDPRLPPAELERRRAQAYQAMAKQLGMDAENAGIRALEDGYDQFRCDLLLDKTHARIRLLFQSEDGTKPPREEIFDLNSNQYIGGYARLGVVPTTLDALNLRIIVNGEIAGDGDFLPILSKTSGGKPRIGKNDFIPNRAIHPEERKTRVTLANNGMYQLELTSRFTKNGDDVTITFPLGIKEDRTDETKDAEARAIADARGKIVTDFIDNYNDKAAKRRKIPVKGDIQEHLETEVRNIRNANTTDPRGQWAYPDRIELLVSDGLQHHYLKLVDPLYEASVKTAKHDETAKKERREARDAIPRVVVYDEEWKESLAKAGEHQYREVKIPLPTLDEHPVQDQQQVTTLGAIALSKKGSNRTYHLDFNLHVNDGTVKTKRREHTAGYNIRGRSLNLCIEDPEVARSRAQEVLFGNKNMLGFVDMVSDYFHQHPQARWALEVVRNGDDEITKKQLAANLEKEVRGILGDDPVRAYRQMLKNELPITILKRRLNVVRNEPQHGVVIIRARIEERQPDKSYALAKGTDNRDLEIIFSVPEKQADVVERFARGDMDGVRLDVLINDQIPRFEHDLSVKIEQGEVKEGKIPVTFSVMRGRRDGKLEQHLDRHGKPARMRLLVPEQQGAFISSADPEKDALAETVDKHVGLLSAIHYSPITPVRPFSDTLRYQELQSQYDQVKKDRDEFIDQTHPDFNPDKPKGWLEHAVTSNMRYHLPDISDVQVLREVRNGNGGGNGHGKPNGIRERFPSELQALREDSLYPQEAPFMERIDKEPRTGFGRRV